jgi:RNA 3'-terminal phosphate cyclase (ATP)
VIISRLPLHIARREIETLCRELDWPEQWTEIRETAAAGPGNAVMIEIESRHVTEVFSGFGQLGVRAEEVAGNAARDALRYLASGVPVGEHLADQLLLPLALAGGGSFRTLPLTLHATTNIATIEKFMDLEIRAEQVGDEVWQVRVGPP